MTTPGPAELLALLIEMAPDLRRVGVRHAELDGLKFDLAPPELEATGRSRDDVSIPDEMDPLNDPATYPGGRVPGFRRPEADEDN